MSVSVTRLAAGVLVLGGIAFAAGSCASESQAPEPSEPASVAAVVYLQLRWPMIADTLDEESAAPEECAGGQDYSEIQTGGAVTFRDAAGKIVGTAKLRPPEPSDNLVICTWTAETSVDSDSEYLTAEVGGWVSAPERVSGDKAIFRLDTIDEDPAFGSTAQIDPTWTRQ